MKAPFYTYGDRAGIIYDPDTSWLHGWSGASDVLIQMTQDGLAGLIRALTVSLHEAQTRQGQSTHNMRCGEFPTQLNADISELLARMLGRREVTDFDAIVGARTHRFASLMGELKNTWGWPIEYEKLDLLCIDGHVAPDVVRYSLSDEVIAAAMAAGAKAWITQVNVARLEWLCKRRSGR